jgi:hypothetical protein
VKDETARVLRWVAQRNTKPGTEETLRLPAELAAASRDGYVLVAATADGRRCVLLKKTVGYKDNFEAVFACTGPLRPDELKTYGSPPRQFISLAGLGVFEELYVRKRIDEHRYEVYFDLN